MTELSFTVDGLPPIKNEALSLLNARHGQTGRVTALLKAARDAMTSAGLDGGFGGALLGLELEIRTTRVPPKGDATNFLGGIGDVLQDKSRREVAHLGELGKVSVFHDDSQVVEIAYRVSQSEHDHYFVRLWAVGEQPG